MRRDLTGNKYHKLTVIKYVGADRQRNSLWECKCECGNLVVVPARDFNGRRQSCGCLRLAGKKPHDLTGQKFGRLVAQEYLGNKRWLCLCECGTEHIAISQHLKDGHTTSCGCYQRECTGQRTRKNIVGNKYNRLTVIRSLGVDKWNKQVWECQCECGNFHKANKHQLESGAIQSCGCYHDEVAGQTRKLKLTGKKIGRLKCVRACCLNDHGNWLWECLCKCGKTIEVPGHALVSGNTKSCGCIKRSDIVGRRFSKLVVIKDTGKTINTGSAFLCRCDCGNEVEVPSGDLKRRHTQSCGCIRKSYGEELIEQYLMRMNADFRREKRFSDCRNLLPLPFDFSVNVNGMLKLIEYHGKHHYEPIGYGSDDNGVENFMQRQRNDAIKERWCKNTGTPLLVIPYWEQDQIEELLDGYLKSEKISAVVEKSTGVV